MANKEIGIAQVTNISQLPGAGEQQLHIPSEGFGNKHIQILRVELSILMGEKKPAPSGGLNLQPFD